MSATSGWSTRALPTVPPPPVTTCSWSAGQAALVDQQLGQRDRGERGLAGRLEHDRAAGGDGRRHLVGHQVEREVERRDGADHADGHPQGEAELALARRRRRRAAPSRPPACGPRPPRTGTCPTARSASTRAVLMGLAASAAMIRAKSSRRSASSRAAASRIAARFHSGSGPAGSAALARRDGAVDVVGGAGRDLADDRAVVGRADGDGLLGGVALAGQRQRTNIGHAADDTAGMSYAFLDHPGPIPFAHRGGALEGLENTMPAFEAAMPSRLPLPGDRRARSRPTACCWPSTTTTSAAPAGARARSASCRGPR